jgi:hypothetical protein
VPWGDLNRGGERPADAPVNHYAGFSCAENWDSTIRDLSVEKRWLKGRDLPTLGQKPREIHVNSHLKRTT